MTSISREEVSAILQSVTDPNNGHDLVSNKAVADIRIESDRVSIDVKLDYPAAGSSELIKQLVVDALQEKNISTDAISVFSEISAHSVQQGLSLLPNVKNTIAVASGKGGVGKSTTSINLALALQAEGANVGILDADIYGPSQPRMLGLTGKPDSPDGKSIEPKISYQLQSMSIGYLIDEETPMIWRGPMVTGALEQLLNETNWRNLDYLVIDLPPGTGDIQLTLCQKIPVSGAVIVTTPQDIALMDAKKALKMFEKVNVPVLGVIENMSTHICSECGHEEHIFGQGGGAKMAEQYEVGLLGSLPLDISIREGVDHGKPTVALQPESDTTKRYREIARKASAKLALSAKDYTSRFPKIVVENN
ncbi:MAG: iron-sulfur cluster carrier protein ApbC [Pseudomonadota bacterium]